jgi:sulfonate transport system substrate-binding protein
MSFRNLAVCALVAAIAAPAFGATPLIDAPAPLNPPVKLTLGAVKVPHVAPFNSIAEAARPLGVEVEIVNFVRYADIRTALASGSIEVGSIGPADVPIAVSQNLRGIIGLMGVGVSAKHPIVRNGVTLERWEDLYGKRVAIAPGSAVWFQFAATVTEQNIAYGRLNIVNIQGGGQPFVQAMERGDIDLFIGWEPFESMAIQQGLGYRQTKLDYSTSRAVGAELGMVGATRTAVEQKREALRRLIFAYLQVQNAISTSKEALGSAIAAWTGLPPQVAKAVADDMTLEQSLTVDQVQRQAKEFHRLGVLARDVSGELPQFFDLSIYQSVVRR